MLIYDNEGVEGKIIYALYWRRPEESTWTRCALYTTEKGRDKAFKEMVRWGLICQIIEWVLPPAPKSV